MPCLAVVTCSAGGPASTSSRRANKQFLSSRPSVLSNDSSNRGQHLYTQALQLARQQDYRAARSAFEECCREAPDNTKVRIVPIVSLTRMYAHRRKITRLQAWVSWAQFEKRVEKTIQGHSDRFQTCREVLQRGLFLNRKSAALVQVLI